MNKDLEKINIDSEASLAFLIKRFSEQPGFAKAFVFANDDLCKRFFESINVDWNLFQKKYYYFDKERNVHIAESESGFVWISTLGLVTTSKITNNNFVNSCSAQGHVLVLLLDEIIAVCSSENCYDIDGALYEQLKKLMPTLFHNTVFYFEILLKAYLSLNGCKIVKDHKLKNLYDTFNQTIIEKGHEHTIFYQLIKPSLGQMINHINSIPAGFKEQYIKYDDNGSDTTFICYDIENLKGFRDIVRIGMDAILDLYYSPTDPLYFNDVNTEEGENIDQNDTTR